MTRKLTVALLTFAILASCNKNDNPAPPASTSYLVTTVFDEAANNFKLVKYNTDGSGEVAFISNRFVAGDIYGVPAVSPKGNRVVYFDGANMKMIDVKTAVETLVYTHANTMIGFPSFSADETKIAFSASPTGDQRADLYIVNAAQNATPAKITSNEVDNMAFYPRFSTDGTKLTFANGKLDDAGIYVSDLQGNNRVRVSETHAAGDDDAYPVFNADGTKVIYTSSKYGQTNGTYELLMSNVTEGAEGAATRMYEATATGVLISLYPVVSPDGGFVYFIGVDAAGAQNIYKVATSGGAPTKIATASTNMSAQLVMNLQYVKE